MLSDSRTRVAVSTVVLFAFVLVVLGLFGVTMPDGLWVLTDVGIFALCYLMSLVIFDDGSA